MAKDAIAELKHLVEQGFARSEKRFEAIDARFDSHDARFDAVDASVAELHRHFDVAVDAVTAQVQAVAEGVTTLAATVERHHAEARRQREEDRAEITSLVRLSFSQLDQRLTSLEGTVADLSGRVERLEARDGNA
jgi:hypothetical protein